MIWILGLTYVIVAPVIAAAVVAAVASPLVPGSTAIACRGCSAAVLVLC